MKMRTKVAFALALTVGVGVGAFALYPVAREKVLLAKAAEGHVPSIIRLSELYQWETLDYSRTDKPRARQLLARSRELLLGPAKEGNLEAMYALGNNYSTPMFENISGERELGREWMEKAASRGHVRAMDWMASDYFRVAGDNVVVAEAQRQGVAWMMKVAATGDADSQAAIGHRYMHGIALPRDYKKAREWLEKASEQGDVSAKRDLGLIHTYRLEPMAIRRLGMPLLIEAAEKGNTDAQTDLITIYMDGKVAPQNYSEARRWALKAAPDSTLAQLTLATLYLDGHGGPKDLVEAYAWTSVAHTRLDRQATQSLLAMLEGEMSSSELEKAQSKAKKYAESVHTIF
jgi:uncharacterized protein